VEVLGQELQLLAQREETLTQLALKLADYVWAVKANQKELHEVLEDYFETAQ
jgi:predicted transposase YbfD/YdcC